MSDNVWCELCGYATQRYAEEQCPHKDCHLTHEREQEMNIPMKPGYYWAKWRIASDGTHEGFDLTPSDIWEVVQVNENNVDDRDNAEYLLVSVPGVRETQWRDGFVWGEFICALKKPPTDAAPHLAVPVIPGDKQLKIFGYAPGGYMTKCLGCGQVKEHLDKLASSCRECAELRYRRVILECAET
jgi:hypothetical protein